MKAGLSGVRRSSVEIYSLSKSISRLSTLNSFDEAHDNAEILERLMGQSMLVRVQNPNSEYNTCEGWVPNHGIVDLTPGELYDVKLKGTGKEETIKVDGSALCWVIDKYHIMPVLESAASAVLAASADHQFSPRAMRYAHQFSDVLLPLWSKRQRQAEQTLIAQLFGQAERDESGNVTRMELVKVLGSTALQDTIRCGLSLPATKDKKAVHAFRDAFEETTSGLGSVIDEQEFGLFLDSYKAHVTKTSRTAAITALLARIKQHDESKPSAEAARVILLVTGIPSTTIIEGNQHSLRNILKGHGIQEWTEVDGCEKAQREERNRLFGISGVRGVYPLVFIKEASGQTKCIGGFEHVQTLNECGQLPPETLEAQPDLETFDKVFASVMGS